MNPSAGLGSVELKAHGGPPCSLLAAGDQLRLTRWFEGLGNDPKGRNPTDGIAPHSGQVDRLSDFPRAAVPSHAG